MIRDGRRIQVTQSLHTALLRFQNSSIIEDELETNEKLPIWADAICINQEDVTEKNEQVRRMDHVYSLCSILIIYLGEPDNEEVDSIRCKIIDKLHQAFQSQETLKLGPFESSRLNTIIYKPWFTRRWVVQESILSVVFLERPGYILLGYHYCRQDVLFEALKKAGRSL